MLMKESAGECCEKNMVRTCGQVLIKRWKEIRAIHKKYKLFYWLLGGVVVVLTAVWIGTQLFHGREDRGYEMNLFTELLGIGITVLGVDRLGVYRDRENLKRRLIREVVNGTNDVATKAVIELQHEGWLGGENGLLKGKNLDGANLRGEALKGVNLEGASLCDTDLCEANLYGANLKDATLHDADMRGANLENADLRADMGTANLQHAVLIGADLRSANLSRENFEEADLMDARLQDALVAHTNLRGAWMKGANLNRAHLYAPDLRGAYMDGVEMSEVLINRYATEELLLPDGKAWDNTTDWDRFTDVFHNEFSSTRRDVEELRIELGFEH